MTAFSCLAFSASPPSYIMHHNIQNKGERGIVIYRKTSIRSRVPVTSRVPVRSRGSRPLARTEAGSRIHAGSRLEAGSTNSFKYGQTPNNLLTLRLTRLTVELVMSLDSIDAEPEEDD